MSSDHAGLNIATTAIIIVQLSADGTANVGRATTAADESPVASPGPC